MDGCTSVFVCFDPGTLCVCVWTGLLPGCNTHPLCCMWPPSEIMVACCSPTNLWPFIPISNNKSRKAHLLHLKSPLLCYDLIPTTQSVGPGSSEQWVWTLMSWRHLVTFCLWLQPGTEDYRSKLGGDCFADLACPEKCRCEGTTVDCSNQKLTKIPDHIPQYTAELWVTLVFVWSSALAPGSSSLSLTTISSVARRLNNNEFTVLEATGIFKKLPHLRKM